MTYTVALHARPQKGFLWGFPFPGSMPVWCPGEDGYWVLLTLTGLSGRLMHQYKEGRGGENQFDLCGVIADAMDENPHEASNEELRAQVVWALRWMFVNRHSAVGHPDFAY